MWYETFIMVSDSMSAETRDAWNEVVPSIVLDEAAFARKREHFRVGTFEPAELCASSSSASLDLTSLVRLLEAGPSPLDRTFLNVGSGNCAPPDPLHALLHSPEGRGFAGLAVDMNATDLAACAGALRRANVTLTTARLALAPPTAAAALRPRLARALPAPPGARAAPRPLGLLVVDVDGCDCPLAEELLQVVRPTILVLEIAFHIPPPFRFSRQHDVTKPSPLLDYEKRSYDPASGCSLSYALHRFRPHGLHLLQLTHQDAVFVHESAKGILERGLGLRLPQDEFQCFRKSRLWMQMPAVYVREWFFGTHPAKSLARIWSNLSQANDLRGRPNSPFTLDY